MKKKLVTEMGRMGREEFITSDKLPLIVVVDNVRSLHNVGSIFRTSDAFRVERVMLCGITATPPNAEIHKTALGAEDVVCWEYFADTMDAVAKLSAEGYGVYAIEQVEGSKLTVIEGDVNGAVARKTYAISKVAGFGEVSVLKDVA